MEEKIDFQKIERKWQKRWEKEKVFDVKEGSGKKKYYVLEMYPYPSASGLHIGHAFSYIVGDIFARFKLMQGFNVLHPMGYDSFGLPAENAAIKANSHPKKFTEKAIENFVRQQKSLGLSYDWSRRIQSHDAEYYKWNQFFFLKFLERGLAYRKKSPVNFCPKCNTVLANEQIHDGKCWRHRDTEVEIRHLEQWFLKTSKYADELLEGIKELDWPERIKLMQENWIGKSHGCEIDFVINGKKWNVFTTRADTIFGVTFMVVSAQHPRLMELVSEEQKRNVEKFLKKIKSTSEKDAIELEKEGVFTGSYVINPINGERVPVWAGNFVVADYGCGMVMAVPAHDQRDFEFAKKYKIPVRIVIQLEKEKIDEKKMQRAYVQEGTLVNSEEFNGIYSKDAIEKISRYLEKKKLGKRVVNYKLRDWLISRQRYWGTPIPVIYCDKCGIVPVLYNELPVLLPEKVVFGKGNPLVTNEKFVNCKCPKCNGKARRETDTMDTFFDSSWYYLRFCDSENKKEAFDKEKAKYWMPVDFYTGGAEHACMHLIYARFFSKVLRDMGYVKYDEPFLKLFNQGMVHGEDGVVMSKSRGNVIDPLDVSKKYGADTLRLFLVSVALPDKDFAWSSAGIEGAWKFVKKILNYVKELDRKPHPSRCSSSLSIQKSQNKTQGLFDSESVKIEKSSAKMEHKINLCLKKVKQEIEGLRYNNAVIAIREMFEHLEPEISKKDLESVVKVFAPFCPHIAEEMWEKIGGKGFVSLSDWPECDEKKINMELEKEEQQIEKLINDIRNILRILESRGEKGKSRVKVFAIPKEVELYSKAVGKIRNVFGIDVEVLNISEASKTGKAIKALPGKPGILIE